jgi:hypothetical protein
VNELTSDLGGLIGSLESSMSAMTDEIGGGIKESGVVVMERYLQPLWMYELFVLWASGWSR